MKLIILDRDGVINHDSDQFIKSPEEWQPIDGSLDAIAFLTQAGYTIAVATNQSGIARGYFNVQTLNEMHAKMHKLVRQAGGEISGVWFCPHTADSQCDCRKPKPGMVLDILDRFQAQAADTYLVGDSLRDLQAIAGAGGKPILVRTGKGMRTLEKDGGNLPPGTQIFDSLLDFAVQLCAPTNPAQAQPENPICPKRSLKP